MHRLAHRLVAAEREGEVGDAAGNMGMRQVLPDPARRLDEVDAVIVVLFEAGRDGENVRIEDDVFRREVQLFDQNVVGAFADLGLARERIGLADSSNAITTTAAPWRCAILASWMNFSTPSFIEIELTIGLP
jgi:hypothetical protein